MYVKEHGCKLLLLIFLLVVVLFFSLICGQLDITVGNVLDILAYKLKLADWNHNSFSKEQLLAIWYIRMPRIIVGALVGMGLAVSGAVMQGVFTNPLADPGIIGVSAGAATGAVLAIVFGLTSVSIYFMPAFALAGSLLAITLTMTLAMQRGKLPVMPLLLAGVAVSMFLGAVTSGILTLANEHKIQEYLFWTIGGLDYRRWEHVQLAIAPILLGVLLMMLMARHLNILALGEVEARSVGMPVAKYRAGLLLLASITTASSVCISGNIGFVGLVVPHIMRIIFGPNHRLVLPASALGGASFLVFCDSLGRIVISNTEIRVGVITAILGAPYFLYLLRKMRY